MAIYQGDKGVVLSITVYDRGQKVSLGGATVTVKIKNGATKTASIVDSINGKVEVTLDATDTANVGTHEFQPIVRFSAEKEHGCTKGMFEVEART